MGLIGPDFCKRYDFGLDIMKGAKEEMSKPYSTGSTCIVDDTITYLSSSLFKCSIVVCWEHTDNDLKRFYTGVLTMHSAIEQRVFTVKNIIEMSFDENTASGQHDSTLDEIEKVLKKHRKKAITRVLAVYATDLELQDDEYDL